MRHSTMLRIGPVGFRIGSDWRSPIATLNDLYRDYPRPQDGIPDFTVRLFAARPWRRWIRPAVHLGGDFVIPEAAPLPLAQGVLAAESDPQRQALRDALAHLEQAVDLLKRALNAG